MGSLSVMLAEQASSKGITSSWRMVIAVAGRSSGSRLAIMGSSSSGVSNEARLTSFTLVSFGVMLAIDAETVFLVALSGVSIAFAFLTETEIESTASTRISWSTVFARCSNVARRTLTLLYFKGRTTSSAVWLSVFKGNIVKRGLSTIVDVGGLDKKCIQISQSHQKMLTSSLLTIHTLPLVFEQLDLDGVLPVGMDSSAVCVLQRDVVSSDDDIRVLVGWSFS